MTTPARQQYLSIKAEHQDAILFFQVGDFFETFDEDAHIASRALQIALTGRRYGADEYVPLAGVPIHALDAYAGKLLDQGFKVAICEQVSPPGRGLVERRVTRILTPGTVTAPNMLPATRDNYLAAIACDDIGLGRKNGTGMGFAYVDVTTGAFACTEWRGERAHDDLRMELNRIIPAEVLIAEGDQSPASTLVAESGLPDAAITRLPERHFRPSAARADLRKHFGVATLAGLGCEDKPLATAAAGAILGYLARMNPALLPLIQSLDVYDTTSAVQVDGRTWRVLEIIEPSRASQQSEGGPTLLSIIDATRTAMGSRLLRRTLLHPVRDRAVLEDRLDAVECLVDDPETRQHITSLLDQAGDLERLTGRIVQGIATTRELYAVAATLQRVPELAMSLMSLRPAGLRMTREQLDPCAEVVDHILRAVANPAVSGGMTIQSGYSEELDRLIASSRHAREWIAGLESIERERTGIRSLKVGFNKVFGYYLEVSHANTSKIPEHYQRRQTLANGERYVTAELKEQEALVLHAEEQIDALEKDLYAAILRDLTSYYERLRRTAEAIAQLDVWLSLAEIAITRDYTRPELTDSTELLIQGGRHSIVETALDGTEFIANDTSLDALDAGKRVRRILLLTGPNMAGKSTYLRQVASIVLLAHIGSFVPARNARIGLVDRIFTRVGAEDDLARGLSTFMVEMVETAHILRSATERSLVILDEVGRGTGTRDGLALARAITEYLHDSVRCRTLFATHYHELATLASALPSLDLAQLEVIEHEDGAIFMHKLIPGASTESYGVHIARMAGLPTNVTQRAHALLNMEHSARIAETGTHYHTSDSPALPEPDDGISLHTAETSMRTLAVALASVNVAGTTPIEALNLLYSLQQRALMALQAEVG